jgi:hypothetical protein
MSGQSDTAAEKNALRFTIDQAKTIINRINDHFKDGGPESLRDKYYPLVEELDGYISEAKAVLALTNANWDQHKSAVVTEKIKKVIRGVETTKIKDEIKYSPPEGRWPGGEGYQATNMKYGPNKDINKGVNQDPNSIFHGIGRRRKTRSRKSRRKTRRRH